jgi:hypothetical protein
MPWADPYVFLTTGAFLPLQRSLCNVRNLYAELLSRLMMIHQRHHMVSMLIVTLSEPVCTVVKTSTSLHSVSELEVYTLKERL